MQPWFAKLSISPQTPETRIVPHRLPTFQCWRAIRTLRECCPGQANRAGSRVQRPPVAPASPPSPAPPQGQCCMGSITCLDGAWGSVCDGPAPLVAGLSPWESHYLGAMVMPCACTVNFLQGAQKTLCCRSALHNNL